jgi:hypothetical protein
MTATTLPTRSRIGHSLYYPFDGEWDGNRLGYAVRSYPITRVTAQRVYFDTRLVDGRTGQPVGPLRESWVSRRQLEETGGVRKDGEQLCTEPPELPTWGRPETPVDLSELRRAMADAHPDRGGTTAQFDAARARYVQARATTRREPK